MGQSFVRSAGERIIRLVLCAIVFLLMIVFGLNQYLIEKYLLEEEKDHTFIEELSMMMKYLWGSYDQKGEDSWNG